VSEKEEAKFAFSLSKPDLDAIRGKLTPELPFKFVLEATDRFGRTSKVSRDMVFTQRPYTAVLELDKDDYPAGEVVKLHAKVTDLDGKPARTVSLTVTVKEFDVVLTATTDDQGVAEFSFPMGRNAGTAVVTSPIMPVPLGTVALRLNQPKPMTSKVSKPPQKEGVKTHFDVTFDPDYVPVEKVIHVDFTDLSGSLVASSTIPVEKDQKGAWVSKGSVAAPTWGTMLANLYVCAARTRDFKEGKLSVRNVGFITEGQHVTLYPDSEATITVRGLKPRVAPGEKVDIVVEVKTRSGQDAALGAAVVDNAVVSLMDPLEVTPADHFYNPQKKVIASSGAGVLTWPVVDRNWGSPWRDIAYSNWGFKDPGGMVDTRRDGMEDAEGSASGVGYGSGGGGIGGAVKSKKSANIQQGMFLFEAGDSGGEYPAQPAPEPPASMAVPDMDMAKEESTAELADKAADEKKGSGRERGPGQAVQKAPARKITIRTRFPETALWEPLLRTTSGETNLSITFPDAITVQQLTLVATDKVGGIGILRQDVEVRQDLFVQSDIPPRLTMGDEVKVGALVRNLSGKTVTLKVAPVLSGAEIVGDAQRTITVEDGGSVPVDWTVRAAFAGKVSWTLVADGDTFRDEEHRTITVEPAGAPAARETQGILSGDKSFEAVVDLDGDATYRTVFLNVTFPNVIPAIQAFEATRELPIQWVGVSGVASRAILDAALLDWGRHSNMPAKEMDALKARIARASAELAAAQNKDGSWGWWYMADSSQKRDGYRVSVYLTAYALRALNLVWKADLLADTGVISRGLDFILAARNKDGLWSPEGAYFWEVNAPETDMPLSADLFGVLVDASRAAGREPGKDLEKITERIEAYLGQNPNEPAGVAQAIYGLMRWAEWRKDAGLRTKLHGSLQYLLSLKRQGHWEPHWYHAYGGMVELNAQILALLREFGGDEFGGVTYEIVTWLLSTREAWGAWHNEIGTANAVRALLMAGAGGRAEVASTVTVAVNGKDVVTVAIDPADPFVSAASLRLVELTPFLHDGTNAVSVRYDGALAGNVLLETRQWGIPGAGTRSSSGAAREALTPEAGATPGPASGPAALSVTRQAERSVDLGAPNDVTLTVTASRAAGQVHVVDSVPSTMEVDVASLEALVQTRQILCYQVQQDHVLLVIEMAAPAGAEARATLSYKLVANREGTSAHRGVTVSAPYDPAFASATFAGESVTVAQ
jgi:uncharacterized protein YfaS (alpha-2-macroglobulin family)